MYYEQHAIIAFVVVYFTAVFLDMDQTINSYSFKKNYEFLRNQTQI